MRIAFLCSGLEPGRDGVGDYTRALARILASRGHEARLASLRDARAAPTPESPGAELRLRDIFQNRGESERLRRWLAEFSPEWASVQYTPFGFHPRGLGGGRASRVRAMMPPGAKHHLMLHEIWLQPGAGGRWRDIALGWFQRGGVDSWLGRGWGPDVIHTQARLHEQRLWARGVEVKLLPLFTTFTSPAADRDRARAQAAEWIHSRTGATISAGDSHAWIGHFGAFHAGGWDFPGFARRLAREYARSGRRACFLAIGRASSVQRVWTATQASVPEADFFSLGEIAEESAPAALASCDAAFTSTPLDVVEKSSAVAAWRALGVPVLVPREGATPRGALPRWPDEGIIAAHADTPVPPARVPAPSFVFPAHAAEQFIADLQRA